MRFSLRGVKVHISVPFALSLCILTLQKAPETLLHTLFSAFLHELGHLCTLISYGERPRELRLGVFGLEIRRAGNLHLSYAQECATALAGPAINLVLAAILLLLRFILPNTNTPYIAEAQKPDYGFFLLPAFINFTLALLNLLPIPPLDGSRALYFSLCSKTGEARARRITDGAGLIALFPLALLGFILLIRSGYNYTLLAVTAYLAVLFISDHTDSDTNKPKREDGSMRKASRYYAKVLPYISTRL